MEDAYWLGTRLADFGRTAEKGEARLLLENLLSTIEEAYIDLLNSEDYERIQQTDEVPVVREGRRGYEEFGGLTLEDLPAILATIEILQREYEAGKREEAEQKKAKRLERRRKLDKERRKRKKLGEF